MKYNFDHVIDRFNTNSIKYDFALEKGKPNDVLPLWIADMDFKAPEEVIGGLCRAAQMGIYGYTEVKSEYFAAVKNWFLKRHGYELKEEWLVKTPGMVFAVAMAIRAFTEENDAVMIQTPVYYPFADMIQRNNRKLIDSPLFIENNYYKIDFEDFEKKIIENKVKLFILCSPHNPVGRVWTEEELKHIGDICLKHNCLVVADEIHCDFIYNPHKHIVFSSISESFADNCLLCTAPSKTFNLAGLQISNIFIKNNKLKNKYIEEINKTGYHHLNMMGLCATEHAYRYGEDWLNQLLVYLKSNVDLIRNFLKNEMPQVTLIEPEGTYLVWLDFRQSGLDISKLDELILNKAKLWFGDGEMFGAKGAGFQRINIACPSSTINTALTRLKKLFE